MNKIAVSVLSLLVMFAFAACATSGAAIPPPPAAAGAAPPPPKAPAPDAKAPSSAGLGVKTAFKTPVVVVDFSKVPEGIIEDVQNNYAETPMPTRMNSNNLEVLVKGKFKISTLKGSSNDKFSDGAMLTANNTSDKGQVIIRGAQGPFSFVVNHAPASTGDAARKLQIALNGVPVVLEGNGDAMSSVFEYKGTDVVEVSAYGWNGEKGAGIVIFDAILLK